MKSSAESLSCSVIFDKVKKMLGFVRLEPFRGKLKMLGAVGLKNFTNLTNMTLANISRAISVGKDCRMISFRTNITSIYMPNVNWTSLLKIAFPSDFKLQAKGKDMDYLVANHKLYRLNYRTSQYDSVFSFPVRYHRYNIKNLKDRVVVSGAKTKIAVNTVSPPINATNYTIHVFSYKTTGMKLIDRFTVFNVKERGKNLTEFFVSPLLSKVAIVFENIRHRMNVTIKHIDYTKDKATRMLIDHAHEFVRAVRGIDPKK